jgi:glucokinase
VNDLEALAWGVIGLADADVTVLNPGVPEAGGNIAVIAAGTGLGEAGLVWDGVHHVPFACEGGHVDFAPRSDLQDRLLRYLRSRWEHVSYERVCSGPGLVHLFEFLRDVERLPDAGAVTDRIAEDDRPGAIAAAALERGVPIAVAALDLFVAIYGAEAGNLALKLKATGGVYVGGGIAPKILAKLGDGTFRSAFVAKGRFADLLGRIPVWVIRAPYVGLRGAAACARRRLAATTR